MSTVASQITSLTIAYSIVYLIANQRKHQSFALLAFVRGIHQRPVDSPHKGPVTLKMFPFDDVIMWKLKVVTWRQLFHHRLHCRLTLSNPPVPRVTMKFSSWQFLVISVFLNKKKHVHVYEQGHSQWEKMKLIVTASYETALLTIWAGGIWLPVDSHDNGSGMKHFYVSLLVAWTNCITNIQFSGDLRRIVFMWRHWNAWWIHESTHCTNHKIHGRIRDNLDTQKHYNYSIDKILLYLRYIAIGKTIIVCLHISFVCSHLTLTVRGYKTRSLPNVDRLIQWRHTAITYALELRYWFADVIMYRMTFHL